MPRKVAFMGMGIMGKLMALNVLKAGNDVMVYNRTASRTAPLAAAGASVADTPEAGAVWADVVILMLTGPEAVDAVVFGDNGIAPAAAGKTVINMSTVSPAYSRQLADQLAGQSVTLIDAPVSGSKKPAEEGSLVILAGGPEDNVKEFDDLFLSMGKKVVYCGPAGMGSVMNMAVNLLLGIMMEGLCEAVNFGETCGLSREVMLDTILPGPLGCGLFNLKEEMLKTGEYPPQFPLKHMTKDLRFALRTADEAGAALPSGTALFQLYREAMGQGLADLDFCAVKKILERRNDR